MRRVTIAILCFVSFAIILSLLGCTDINKGIIDDPDYNRVQSIYPDKTVIVCNYNGVLQNKTPPEKEINEYLVELGCDFVICFVSTNYDENAIKNRIAEGKQIDIIYSAPLGSSDADVYSYYKLYYDNLYVCLDEYLFGTEEGIKLYRAFPQKHWEELKISGKIYGVNGSLTSVTTNFGYLYREDLTKKYDYDIAKSPLQQMDLLKDISLAEGIVPFWVGDDLFKMVGYTDSRRLAWGVVFNEAENCAISILEDAEYIENLRIVYTLVQNGLADCENRSDYFAIRYFSFTNIENGVPINYLGDEMLPQMKNTPKMQCPVCVNGIYIGSDNKDEAFEFLSLCMTDSFLNNLLVYGVENVDYSVDTLGYVNDRWDPIGGSISQFINRYIALPNSIEGSIKTSVEQYTTTMDSAILRGNSAGFALDVNTVCNESRAVFSVLKDMSKAVMNASSDVSFEDFIAEYKVKLSEAGINKIIFEANMQYESYVNEQMLDEN